VSPADRFEWWRNEFSGVHKVEVPAERRREFTALGRHWQLNRILLGHYRTASRQVVRTPADIRRDNLDHWVLRIAIDGYLECRGQSGTFRVVSGQVTVGTFAQSYSDYYSTGEWIAVMIPRDLLPRFGMARQGRKSGVLSGGVALLLKDFLISLVQRLRQRPADLLSLSQVAQAMIIACLEGDGAPISDRIVPRSVAMRAQVDHVIRRNIGSARPTPDRVCDASGLSRSVLYRLFEDRGGVAAYIQNMRLELVRAELENPSRAGETISSIAARHGLHNSAAFCRAFRQKFGCTAGEVRATSGDPHPREHRPQRGTFLSLLD